jgi:hypothetical protein
MPDSWRIAWLELRTARLYGCKLSTSLPQMAVVDSLTSKDRHTTLGSS